MKKKITVFIFVFMMIAIHAAAAEIAAPFIPTDPILPLSQVKAGMKAEIRTVLHGNKITPFSATLIGVVPRKTSPKNLILVRVDDKYVRASGGIAAGMSGSPVYVGGKLVGAIGYGWSFGDNNLGLVTPIEEMIKALNWPDRIPPFGVAPKVAQEPLSMDIAPASKDAENAPVFGDEDLADAAAVSASSDDVISEDLISADASIDVSALKDIELKPLAMPMLADGISSRIAAEIQKRLGLTIVPLGGGSSSAGIARLNAEPEPGSAVGASLAWGDVQIGGIGTLTAKSKDGRFIAFGHPMAGQGAVAYPLTEATILQVIPSIRDSFKLGYQGPIIGIITQDRPEAIAGHLGQLAPAMSYTVKLNDVDNKRLYVKRFQTAADSFSGPVTGTLGMLGVIDDLWARKGQGTAILKYRFSGGNLVNGWERRNIFFSEKDLVKTLLEEFDDLSNLFALNQFQEIRPFGVDLDVEITSDARVVFIEKIDIPDKKEFYAPGDKLNIDVTLRPWRKRPMVKRIKLTVPKNAVGFSEIVVRGGGIEEPEQSAIANGLRSITNLKDLMKELSITETNNQIFAEISGPEIKEKNKDKDKEKSAGKDKSKDNGSGNEDKAGDNKNKDKGKDKNKDKKEDLSIEDMMDSRLQSEIREESLKENSLQIIDTNYYVDGLLRKFIKIKRSDGKTDEGPTEEEEKVMRAQAEALQAEESDDGEEPPDDEACESRGFTFRFPHRTALTDR
jgi:hypothetical protein